MMPDGSPQGAGSASHAATAALTSERFAGPIILITGARDVTDYAAAHRGQSQSLPPEIIIQFAGGLTQGASLQAFTPKMYKTTAILVSGGNRGGGIDPDSAEWDSSCLVCCWYLSLITGTSYFIIDYL